LIDVSGTGLEISSVTYEGGDLLVRLFNAEGDNGLKKLSFDGKADKAEMVELNGHKVEDVKMNIGNDSRTTIKISIPKFGIRTLKFVELVPSRKPLL
jgi:alpha-mannosidase